LFLLLRCRLLSCKAKKYLKQKKVKNKNTTNHKKKYLCTYIVFFALNNIFPFELNDKNISYETLKGIKI